MKNALQRRYFLAALIGSATWHHGFLIPTKPPRHLPQRLRLALIGHQIGKGRVVRGHAVPFRIEPAIG